MKNKLTDLFKSKEIDLKNELLKPTKNIERYREIYRRSSWERFV